MRADFVLASLAVALVVLAATPASACLPSTRPASATAEDLAREEVERQQALWRKADIVFVATVADRTWEPMEPLGLMARLRVHPERSLKGVLPPRDFEIGVTGMTSCGPAPFFDIFETKGEFVVFVRGPYPAQEAVLNTLAVGRVTATEMRTLLDGLGYPSR